MVVENLWWYCASHGGGGGGGGGGCRRGGGDFGIVVPVVGVDVVLMDPSACAHDMRFLPGIDFASAPGTTGLAQALLLHLAPGFMHRGSNLAASAPSLPQDSRMPDGAWLHARCRYTISERDV